MCVNIYVLERIASIDTKPYRGSEEREGNNVGDRSECAVLNGPSSSRGFSGNWAGDLRFHCFNPLLCCFLAQRQGRLLNPRKCVPF
ncbi:hypothetical protein ACSBR1_036686 [Camellia fascicularis]